MMPLVLSILFLCLSVTLLAQASITVYTYNKESRARDLNFWWSCLIIVVSIIGTIVSMVAVFANRGAATTAMAGTGAAGSTTVIPPAAVLGTQLEAAQNLEQAQAEAAKVFKA